MDSYILMAWPFQLKFEIYVFGVMILQMKKKTKFWKIGPCIFKRSFTNTLDTSGTLPDNSA